MNYFLKIFIALGQGNSQIYAQKIKDGFLSAGHQVTTFDLANNYYPDQLLAKIKKFEPDFSFGFNGVYPILNEEEDIYDLLDIPHFSFLIDHPVRQINRFENFRSDNLIISAVDRTHIDYLKLVGKENGVYFLPHGFARDRVEESMETSLNQTDCDLIFFGTISAPEKYEQAVQEKVPTEYYRIYKNTLARLQRNPLNSIHSELKQVLDKVGASELFEDNNFRNSSIVIIETLLRRQNRLKILQKLNEYNLHIYGNINLSREKLGKNIKIKSTQPINKAEMMNKMASSKIVLDTSTFFPEGGHIRILHGLLNHRPVLTSRSKYINEEYGHDKCIQEYLTGSPASITATCEKMLNDYSAMTESVQKVRKRILSEDTWKHRADTIIEIMKEKLEE